MDYSKKYSITNLAIFTLFTATTLILLICSWQPLRYKSQLQFLSHEKIASNINTTNSIIIKDELDVALEKASMAKKTVIITVINKAYVEPHRNDYPAMFDLFLEGFWAGEETRPLVDHLLVVAMDKTAHERCVFRRLNCYSLAGKDDGGGGDRFAGEKIYMSDEFIEMMWRRTGFLLDVLKRGHNFIFTDTDVLWLRNPFTKLSTNETVDLQLSTDVFNGNATSSKNLINTGFYFIRSNEKTVTLFQTWYDMRKNSTGLKEQDVLANLIRDGVFGQLDLNARLLDTLYFSGFCKDSRDVRLVATVHANCCRSIGAKVADLKVVLQDWERFKRLWKLIKIGAADGESRNGKILRRMIRRFRWSGHRSCFNSWHNTTSLE